MSKQLNRIKVILAEKQLTNKWLADELHRDQTTVSRWVTNTCQPSFKTMIKSPMLLMLHLMIWQEET